MKKNILIILSALIVSAAALAGYYFFHKTESQLSYPSFLEAVNLDQVEEVILAENSNTFKARLDADPDILYEVPNPKTENFTEFLLIHDIKVNYRSTATSNVLQILLVAFIAGGILWYSRKGGNKSLIINANKNKKQTKTMTLDQVAGNAEAKSMVEDVIGFIKNPEQYASVGARMPK